jgi:microcystin-dependent protein
VIQTGIDAVDTVNSAYAQLSWLKSPSQNVTDYVVSYYIDGQPNQIYQSYTPFTNIKIGGLYPGVTYWFSVRARNSTGQLGAFTGYTSVTMPVDTTPPATPVGLNAQASLRGAIVTCQPNTEPDLRGYLFQVSVGGAPYVPINPEPQTGAFLNYQAPPGTPTGTSLAFIVAAVDWTGNDSPYSDPTQVIDGANTAQTVGVPFDEIIAGNLSVFGTISAGGGLQTAQSGQRVVVDDTGVTLYDGSGTDYGGGVGVTVKLAAATGSGFFSGTLVSKSLLTGGIQSAAGQAVPDIPANFSGFQLDATYGMRFYNSGILSAQFAANGEIDIWSAANLSLNGGTIKGSVIQASVLESPPGVQPSAVFDLTGTPNIVFSDQNGVSRLTLGQFTSTVDGSTQYGAQGKDATGRVAFDTAPAHPWAGASQHVSDLTYTGFRDAGPPASPVAPSIGQALPQATITVNNLAPWGIRRYTPAAGVAMVVQGGVWGSPVTFVRFSDVVGTTQLVGCSGGSGWTLAAGDYIVPGFANGPNRRMVTITFGNNNNWFAFTTLAGKYVNVGATGSIYTDAPQLGEIIISSIAISDPNYLLCDGSAFNTSTYADLNSTGYAPYSLGHVPDMRGYMPMGVGTPPGGSALALLGTAGSAAHTLTSAEMPGHTHAGPSHTHTGAAHSHSHNHGPNTGTTFITQGSSIVVASGAGSPFGSSGLTDTDATGASAGNTGSGGTGASGSTGAGGSHSVLNPVMGFYFYVRAQVSLTQVIGMLTFPVDPNGFYGVTPDIGAESYLSWLEVDYP